MALALLILVLNWFLGTRPLLPIYSALFPHFPASELDAGSHFQSCIISQIGPRHWIKGYKLCLPNLDHFLGSLPSMLHTALGRKPSRSPKVPTPLLSIIGGLTISSSKSEPSPHVGCILNSCFPLGNGRYYSSPPQSSIAILWGPALYVCFVCFVSGNSLETSFQWKKNDCGNPKKLKVGVSTGGLVQGPRSRKGLQRPSIFLPHCTDRDGGHLTKVPEYSEQG